MNAVLLIGGPDSALVSGSESQASQRRQRHKLLWGENEDIFVNQARSSLFPELQHFPHTSSDSEIMLR